MSAFNDPRLLRAKIPPEGEPRCRRCDYDLRGLPANAVCPECGAPRSRKLPGRIDPEDGRLVLARSGEIRRFGIAFIFMGLVVTLAPALPALTLAPREVAGVVSLTVAAAWFFGVAALSVRRFACGEEPPPETRFSKSLRALAVVTQWAWIAAAGAAMLGLGPIYWGVFAGIGGLGLLPTFWLAGDVLEWGGDDAGGRVARRLALNALLAGALLAFGATIAILLSPLWQNLLPFLVLFATGLALLVVYFRTVAALLGGASMARWALVCQRDREGKIERLRERAEREEAMQRERVSASEARHIARRAGADRPVSVDDFRD